MTIKKQELHYIPNNSYLKNFADRSGKVWVLDSKDKIYSTNPTNIFKEKNFYTVTLNDNGGSLFVEDTLANIEAGLSDIYQNKINKGLSLTRQERVCVSIFVAAMFLRTKTFREGLKNMLTNLKGSMEEWKERIENNEEAKKFYSAIPSDPDAPTINLEDVSNAVENSDEIHSVQVLESLPEIAQHIFDMKWCYMKISNDKDVFVTSNDPFQITRPEAIKKYGPRAIGSRPGLLFEDTEVTIPFSSKIALAAAWKWKFNNDFIEATPRQVEQINIRTISRANEKVVANNKEILERILEDSLKRQNPGNKK